VITTNCEGEDLSSTEFAFDCVGQHTKVDVVRHSFGVGGFETNEEFDTEVKCRHCANVGQGAVEPEAPAKEVKPVFKEPVPASVAPHSPGGAPTPAKKEEKDTIVKGTVALRAKATGRSGKGSASQGAAGQQNEQEKEKKSEPAAAGESFPLPSAVKGEPADGVVTYGPKKCVSVFKAESGNCIMNTDCANADISNYEFGLVCVDKKGMPVKHLFGRDSFDAKESFDSLIKCDKCLGLEDIPDTVALAGEVASMAKDVAAIKAVMQNISINVNMLNKEVFKSSASPGPAAPAPAPAAEAPAAAEDAKPQKFMVSQAVSHSKHHHRGNLRHSHKKHHRHHRREEDEDDDREDDRDEDRDEDEDSDESEESGVAEVSFAANRILQQRADRAAEAAKFQAVPMNRVSSLAQQSKDDDDDEDSEGDDE